MARVERFSSNTPVPVEQAQLVNPSAFRFGDFNAQELKVIGGTLEELGLRHIAAQDSLSINNASESRDLAALQMKQFMLDNSDPDTWSEGARGILSNQQTVYNQQKMSAQAKANEDIEQQAFEDELSLQTQIAVTGQTIANDITVSGKNLISKISSDDGSVNAAADIDKHLKLYQDALERKFAPEVAAIQMEETLRQAEKQKIAALVNQGRYNEAEELATKTTSLTPTERKSQLDIIDRARNAKKNKSEIAQEAYINETHKLTLDTLSQDINDLEVFDKLPDDLRTYWGAKLTDRNKMIKAGRGDSFINVYDPARYNSFRTLMEQDPENLKESQIVDAVGYGLTVEQGVDLIERHRKLSRKDTPLTAPEARRGVSRINNAFKAGIIKHPDFIEGAVAGSEDEYKNSLLRDQMIDGLEDWLTEKPRTPEEIRQHTVGMLKPYEEMEARGIVSKLFHNIFSRESWVFSAGDYRRAISSLNKDAQAEWQFQGMGQREHPWWGGTYPEDFIRKWQSPHKILTPEIARIYKKWAHGDLGDAKAMATKDGWKEPK